MGKYNPFDPRNRKVLVFAVGAALNVLADLYPGLPDKYKYLAGAAFLVAGYFGIWHAKNAPSLP